jgi:hypothetical protein
MILPAASTTGPDGQVDQAKIPEPIKTPDQLAKDLLDQITPSTTVSVTTPAYVAGRAVYELVLQPKAAESTVDHVGISIDSATGLPLRVGVFAKSLPKGHSKLALELGFTSVSFSRPAASTFKFSPPPGSTVTTNDMRAGRHQSTAASNSDQANAAQAKANHGLLHRRNLYHGQTDLYPAMTGQNTLTTGKTVTVGQDWTTVAIMSNAQLPEQAYEVLRSATPVSGAFGSGRLVESPLVNALVLDDGRIAVGAVTPQALEAAVASAH